MGGRRVQEARDRPGGLLAQRWAAGVPVPRPQRHPVPQRCAAAGAAGAGGHPGSPGTGRGPGLAVLVRAAAGTAAAAGQPDAMRGCRSGAGSLRAKRARTRYCPMSLRRRRTRRPAAQRRVFRSPVGPGSRRPTFRARRCRLRRDRPGRAPSRWDRPVRPRRPPAPGAVAGTPGASGTRAAVAGSVHHPGGTGGSGYGSSFKIRTCTCQFALRARVVIGSLAVVVALLLGFVGCEVYQKLTNNTVVAYFPEASRCIPATGSRSWAFGWVRSTRSSRPATR